MRTCKTALLGGTFNPPHNVHVDMVKFALEQLHFDRVLVLPAAEPPHKDVAEKVSAQVRLELTRLAFEGIPCAEVSDFELRRKGKSYTYETLRLLHEQQGEGEISLLMGQDMLETTPQWYRGEDLLRETPIVVYPRPLLEGEEREEELSSLVEHLQRAYQARITVAGFPMKDVSSTELREQIRKGPLPRTVPAKVLREVLAKGLYGVQFDASRGKTERERELITLLSKRLSEKRLHHSIAVMEEMERLAQRYGLDVARARIAGLVHDCTKDETFENQLRLCEEFGIIISDLERYSPKLLHAITGAAYARVRFGLKDEEALGAIRYHTTARADMTLFEALLYLADYVEPLRAFEGVEQVRRLVDDRLEEALLTALDATIGELVELGSLIHPDTLAARNSILMQSIKENCHAV